MCTVDCQKGLIYPVSEDLKKMNKWSQFQTKIVRGTKNKTGDETKDERRVRGIYDFLAHHQYNA